MIYTLTFNPSIDYYLHLPSLKKGEINRVKEYEFVAGSKGINVSAMLSKLSINSTCIFFSGGFTGKFIEEELSKDSNITIKPIKTQAPSRINVKIRGCEETDLNTAGAPLTQEVIDELINYLEVLKEDDYLCICGSLQNNQLTEVIVQIAKIANSKKAKLVLDVPNMNLQQIVACKPYMIKPNVEELQILLNSNLEYPEICKEAKDKLIDQQVENIYLSMGNEGSCFINSQKVVKVNGPNLKPLNTVAAGDSLLATTIGKLYEGASIEEAIAYGSAAGSAAVMVPYVPAIQEVEEMKKLVSLEPIVL